MYDYGSDKFNSRGCFNLCNCDICRKKKNKIRKDSARAESSTSVKNRMLTVKKRARQESKKSNKCYAEMYIDDAALGCPLLHDKELSDRDFVDWVKVREILTQKGLFIKK